MRNVRRRDDRFRCPIVGPFTAVYCKRRSPGIHPYPQGPSPYSSLRIKTLAFERSTTVEQLFVALNLGHDRGGT